MMDHPPPDRRAAHEDHAIAWHGLIPIPGRPAPAFDRLPDSMLREDTRARLDRCKKTTAVAMQLNRLNSAALLPPGSPGTGPLDLAMGYRLAEAACRELAEGCEREARR